MLFAVWLVSAVISGIISCSETVTLSEPKRRTENQHVTVYALLTSRIVTDKSGISHIWITVLDVEHIGGSRVRPTQCKLSLKVAVSTSDQP